LIRYLGVLGRVSSIMIRRSSVLALTASTAVNTVLLLALPRIPALAVYAVVSSLAISLLILGELRPALEVFSKALQYCGGSRGDRLAVILYLSLFLSTPSYFSAAVLGSPYIPFIAVIITILAVSRMLSPRVY